MTLGGSEMQTQMNETTLTFRLPIAKSRIMWLRQDKKIDTQMRIQSLKILKLEIRENLNRLEQAWSERRQEEGKGYFVKWKLGTHDNDKVNKRKDENKKVQNEKREMFSIVKGNDRSKIA